MTKKLRVGNLGFAINAAGLTEIFAACGTVTSARIVEDQYSGKSRGFGFVEMSTPEEAADCIARLHGQETEGRVITVAEAPPEAKGRAKKR